jgi:hypothetical protein
MIYSRYSGGKIPPKVTEVDDDKVYIFISGDFVSDNIGNDEFWRLFKKYTRRKLR